MELTKQYFTAIKGFIDKWITDPRFEVETTFGSGGVVDSMTFLQIAQRLRSKGFTPRQQEDKLNILTQENIRFTLGSMGTLQSYCSDDTLENKPFSAMIKDRAVADSNVDLSEYDMRVKIRREEELSRDHPTVVKLLGRWATLKKAFRWIRRWSFIDETKGIRIDLSMVRQTPTVGKDLAWATTFQERSVLLEMPRYEVEVELLHDTPATETPEKAMKALIVGAGEVLRAIQKNTLLIKKSTSRSVREEYAIMTGSDKFRGVGPITLQVENMTSEKMDGITNVRDGFNVTDKADGLRAMGICTKEGELFLMDQSMTVYRTGLRNRLCASSLVDGEWITYTADGQAINHYLIFDIYYTMEGDGKAKKVSHLPFATFDEKGEPNDVKTSETRYGYLQEWMESWNEPDQVEEVAKGITDTNRLLVIAKQFLFGKEGTDRIFTHACSAILDTSHIYHTDGLILTSNSAPLPDAAGVRFEKQFKWKPAKDNTVDFLVRFEKEVSSPSVDRVYTTVHPETNETVSYKTMRLYVGSSKNGVDQNPRLAVLNEIHVKKEVSRSYRPSLFTPMEYHDTMANVCYLTMHVDVEHQEEYGMTEDSKEPITENSIIEMRYDPSREPGWRWVPSRIRHDKTERLNRAIAKGGEIKYSGMMNDEGVANGVWNSIHNPITESMIRTGSDQPSQNEIHHLMSIHTSEVSKQYYHRRAPQQNLMLVKGLQDFHNKYIKNDILLHSVLRVGGMKTVLDLACGKAGDLYKWKFNGATHVVGIDYSGENITNTQDGAYKRYVESLKEFGYGRVPRIVFAIGNSSRNIVDGSAGSNSEEANILRSIFGKVAPDGPVPPYVQKHMAGQYRNGADVAACMFALHYFFENTETLNGFLKNLEETVKVGGYFIGCCPDGQKVFELLEGVEKGQSRSGMEGDVPIWTITRQYDIDTFAPDDTSVGLPVDIEFISIGEKHTEYLVNFPYLTERLKKIGFRLMTPKECSRLNLKSSTNLFDVSYRMAEQRKMGPADKPRHFEMGESVKEFSFLNRWFIFVRKGSEELEEKIAAEQIARDAVEEVDEEKKSVEKRPFEPAILEANKTGTYRRFSTVQSSDYSVLKPWEKPQVRRILEEWFPNKSKVKHIIDATAHIGVDTIHFSDVFEQARIDAFEIVPETYQKLVENIKEFHKEGQIRPYPQDITTWSPQEGDRIDFLYVDPPWGGKEYSKKKTLDLYLQKEGNAANERKNVNQLIDQWIQSQKVKHVILKAPYNFDLTYLQSHYDVLTQVVRKRASENTAYLLILIRSPHIEEESDMVVPLLSKKPKATEEKEEKISMQYSIFAPERVFTTSEIFPIGLGVATQNILSVPDAESGKSDVHIGRWMAPGSPFPIPDPEDKTILYPTIEHYMAAMKLRHASTEKDTADGGKKRAMVLYSTTGTIHQTFLSDPKYAKAAIHSNTYYEGLKKEVEAIRATFAKGGALNKARIVVDDDRWNTMKQDWMNAAVQYRYENDARFQRGANAAKTQGKYILYSVSSKNGVKSPELSEWGGQHTVGASSTSPIQGQNLYGKAIMKAVGYE